MTEEQFSSNDLVQDGVVRRLEIIGEAARSIDPALIWGVVKKRLPEWKEKFRKAFQL